MVRILFPVLLLILTAGCQQQQDDAHQISNITGGRCFLQKDGHNYLCFDFRAGSDSNVNSDTCTSEYNRYLSGYGGARGKDWLSGDANTCSAGTSDTAVGTCTRSDVVIYYYNTDWSAGSAQTDCTSVQSGTWSL